MRAIWTILDLRLGTKRSSGHDSARKMIESIAPDNTTIHLFDDLVHYGQIGLDANQIANVFSLCRVFRY